MTAKHTPGPWRWEDARTCRHLMGKDGGLGYSIAKPKITDLPIVEANAHLIAAAPDLLEALQDALQYLEHHLPDEVLEPHKAAIDKALKG